MKTIELAGITYQIKDYISAPDMVGLNIFALFALTEKMSQTKDEGEIFQIIIDNMGELTKLVQRLVRSPKIVEPKMSLILGLFMQPEFMGSFNESFEGLAEMIPAKKE